LPGLRMPRGSSAPLMACMWARARGCSSRSTKSRFSSPTPCSRDGHGHVFVDLFGGHLAQGGGEGAAHLPQGSHPLGRVGVDQIHQAVHPRRLGDPFGGGVQARLRAVHLDHEQGAGVFRQGAGAVVADHGDGGAVHEFQGAGGDRLGHDARHRPRRGVHVVVHRLQGALAFRQGGEAQGGLGDHRQGALGADEQAGDHRQGALGADEQAGEVVAHHPLAGAGAATEGAAQAVHRRQPQGVLARGAV